MEPQGVFRSDVGDTCFYWCGDQLHELTRLKLKADYSDSLNTLHEAQLETLQEKVTLLSKKNKEEVRILTNEYNDLFSCFEKERNRKYLWKGLSLGLGFLITGTLITK